MKVAVLVNAHAGSIGTEKFEEKRAAIETAMTEAGLEATIYACEPAALESTARRTAASGIDAVIAAGGDGTISSVAAALVGGSTPLAVLPLGTRNVLARCCRNTSSTRRASSTIRSSAPVTELDLRAIAPRKIAADVGNPSGHPGGSVANAD